MGFFDKLFTIPDALIEKSSHLVAVCKSPENKKLAKDIHELLSFLQKNNKISSFLTNAIEIKDRGRLIKDRLIKLKVTDEDSYKDAQNLAKFFEEVSTMHGKYKGTIFESNHVTIEVPGIGTKSINLKEVSDSYHQRINAKIVEFEAKIVEKPSKIYPEPKNLTPSPVSQNSLDNEVENHYIYVKTTKSKFKTPKAAWKLLTEKFSAFVPEEAEEQTLTKEKNSRKKQAFVEKTPSVNPSPTKNPPELTRQYKELIPKEPAPDNYQTVSNCNPHPTSVSQIGLFSERDSNIPSEKPSSNQNNYQSGEMPAWAFWTCLLIVVGIPILIVYGIYKLIVDNCPPTANEGSNLNPRM